MEFDERRFRSYLRRGGRSDSATERCVTMVWDFTQSLARPIEAASPDDLARYVREREAVGAAKTNLWALGYFFDFIDRPEMAMEARRLRKNLITRRSLSIGKLRGIDSRLVDELVGLDIHNTDGLLDATESAEAVCDLAAAAGADAVSIDDLRQLCRFCLIDGVGPTRSRLYRDTVGSIDRLAELTPDDLIAVTTRYIATAGFDGVPPTPREAQFTIGESKRLADLPDIPL